MTIPELLQILHGSEQRLHCGCTLRGNPARTNIVAEPCMTHSFRGAMQISVEIDVLARQRPAQGVGLRDPGSIDRLSTPEEPLAGVEQYDSVSQRSREVVECSHAGATARFQCMRCLSWSRLCYPCSMAGICPHCQQRQPKTVEAFMAGLESGLNGDGILTPAEMAAEAKELDAHFGDDMKIRIFGNEGRDGTR